MGAADGLGVDVVDVSSIPHILLFEGDQGSEGRPVGVNTSTAPPILAVVGVLSSIEKR